MHSAIKRTLIITLIFAAPASASATPIAFNFTGTFSDYILSQGKLQKTYSAIPKWNGKSVSSSLVMEVDEVTHPEFAKNENYGVVAYIKANGGKMDYAFRGDSLIRVSEVSEPNSLWLVALGFAGLLINRARRAKSRR